MEYKIIILIGFLISVKYIKLPKSTRSTKKYSSPYLEPLPQPDHPWSKVKEVKFHNMKVRKQRMRNKMKAIQLQQQYDKEVNNNHHTRNSLGTINNIVDMAFNFYNVVDSKI